jgi:hypothetical protein
LYRVSKHIFVKPLTNNPYWVDIAGIGGGNMSLPGGQSVKKMSCRHF